MRSPNTCWASAAAADGTDAGLSPIAVSIRTRLPGVQRLAEEPVEKRACRAGFERRPHLAEDLSLAGNERVEPGGDSKQVERRRLVPQAIQRGGEIVSPIAGQLDERVDRFVVGVLLADEIELGAIAGREHDRLALELCASRWASARHASRSSATRSRSSIGAR